MECLVGKGCLGVEHIGNGGVRKEGELVGTGIVVPIRNRRKRVFSQSELLRVCGMSGKAFSLGTPCPDIRVDRLKRVRSVQGRGLARDLITGHLCTDERPLLEAREVQE